MGNFLKETLDIMDKNGKSKEDIVRIGNENYEIDFDTFSRLANKEYNNQSVTFRVAYDLVIVFSDNSWIERMHDVSMEYWRYNKVPTLKKKSRKIKQIFGMDQTLEQLYNK